MVRTLHGGTPHDPENMSRKHVLLLNSFVLPVIDIQAFERLLGPCMDIMKRNISLYEDQLVALFGSSDDLKH